MNWRILGETFKDLGYIAFLILAIFSPLVLSIFLFNYFEGYWKMVAGVPILIMVVYMSYDLKKFEEWKQEQNE